MVLIWLPAPGIMLLRLCSSLQRQTSLELTSQWLGWIWANLVLVLFSNCPALQNWHFSCKGYFLVWLGVDFIKQFMPYTWNLHSAPILFEQIYSNLTSCIYNLRSTFCIVSQIFGALYAIRPAPKWKLEVLGPSSSTILWNHTINAVV